MQPQKLSKLPLHLLPLHDCIQKPVLQQKFCALKSFWQLLPDRLLNHARSGKADQRTRLCKNHISLHCKAGRHTTHCRVSQHADIQKTRVTVPPQRR